MYDDDEIDLRTLKYVLYLRKSTEDEGRQIRSIKDQERDCRDLAKRLGLNIVATISEQKSAKKPNNRPEFTAMLKRMRAKEFDGIIAWHPDRLAKNMVEAGRIIHMLDTDVIKDIQFVSHQFSNDANGKMLLGMLFVFSKHYSDDLSTKVTRGVKGNLRDYKSGGTPKHGYIRDDEGIYRTDDNFKIMQRAWELSPSLSLIKDERALQTITEQLAEASQIVQQQEQLIEKYQRNIERSTLPAIDKDASKLP